MSQSQMIMFYVPCSGRKEAMEIARSLLSKRLIACANILPGCISLYEWEGELKEEQEAILIMKTVKSLHMEVEKSIMDLHNYKCPCIVALDTAEVNMPFVEWVQDQIKV